MNETINQLRLLIVRKIRMRELRISVNSMTLVAEDFIPLPPPDYGLGTIPTISSIMDSNHKALKAIEECHKSIKKLHLIADKLNQHNYIQVKKLLDGDSFDKMSRKSLQGALAKDTFKVQASS